MKTANTYVYFALKGDNFNPDSITNKIGIEPTDSGKKGDKGKFTSVLKHSYWELSTEKGMENLFVGRLVDEIVNKLFDKVDIINELKKEYQLNSVLEIVLYIDINPTQSTPALGHNLKVIEFLHRTQTKTDVDIYRFDSTKQLDK